MIQAGADEPLIEDVNGQAAFRPESFLRRVLTNTGSNGHALSAPDSFMQEINAQKVSATLLSKVMHLWASLPRDEWRDFDQKLERVVELIAQEHGARGPRCSRCRLRSGSWRSMP